MGQGVATVGFMLMEGLLVEVMEGPLVGEPVAVVGTQVVVELLLGEPVVPFQRAVAGLVRVPSHDSSRADTASPSFLQLRRVLPRCRPAPSTRALASAPLQALVYEFMPRGDLHKLLYSTRDNEGSLDLNLITMAQRMSIVVDVADALEYQHHNNQGTMVHCDLKPSNILLDNNMTAHVGDFGLTRFKVDSTTLSLGNPNSSSVGLVGTIGYAALEYAGGSQVSTAADVYSFGVVLLEIFIRKRPTDDLLKDELSIVKFTEINFPDRVLEIVDPEMIPELELCQETPVASSEKGLRSLVSMLNIGLCCTKPSPGERINMHEAAAKLHGMRDAYLRGN
ncbi:hypothetical protein ACQ4PT_039320 [Festuca glaucescens]